MLPVSAQESRADKPTINITGSSVALKVGETANLEAKVQGISESDTIEIKWLSSDPARVSVTPDPDNSTKATITALKTGETTETKKVTITAELWITNKTDKELKDTASYEVTVSPADAPGISVSPTSVELKPGNTKTLKATVTPSTDSQEVTWRSDNTAVATVNAETGEVTAVAAGVAKITATSKANNMEASCTVTVQGIVLADESVTINERGTYTLNYTVYGESLKKNAILWSSSDDSIVTVDSGYLTGMSVGQATITAKIDGVTLSDTCKVTVKSNTAEVIKATAETGTPLRFSSLVSQFQNRSSTVLGKSLSYLSGLSVPTDQGTLYYRYVGEGDTGAGIGTSERFYVSPGAGQLALSEIIFVPKAGFSGTATISYTGYVSGTEFFTGSMEISVAQQVDVTYSTANGKAVQLDPYDFSLVCQNKTGRDLSYITFTLPDAEDGSLVYNYLSAQNPGTPVRTNEPYKYTGYPSLGSVFFLPAPDAAGTVRLSYTGWNVNGESYEATLIIRIGTDTDAEYIARYSVSRGNTVSFRSSDFNELAQEFNNKDLRYVRFTDLPAASRGVLYYNGNTKVSTSLSYYHTTSSSSSRLLNNVSFTAASDFTGTLDIPFTGVTTNGERFSGSVRIVVTQPSTGTKTISYATRYSPVLFYTSDFISACVAYGLDDLVSVQFLTTSVPGAGTLYSSYGGIRSVNVKASSATKYRVDGTPALSQLVFVPRVGYQGTVTLDYTGTDVNGKTYQGQVRITITPNTLSSYFVDLGNYTWAVASVDYLAGQSIISGTGRRTFSPGNPISRGDFVLMLDRTFDFPSTALGGFPDVPQNSYYAAAIRNASAAGVATGLSDGTFRPNAPISRAEAMTMLYRAVQLKGWTMGAGSTSLLTLYPDGSTVPQYAQKAMSVMIDAGIIGGTGAGLLEPNRSMTRAEMAVVLARLITL